MNELSIEQLRSELLALMLEEQVQAGAGHDGAIPALPRGGTAPASYAQERLWFIDRIESGASGRPSATYTMPFAFRLRGPLERRCLRAALQRLMDRHNSLRTGLKLEDGRTCQQISPALALALEETDLTALAPSEREAAARSHIAANAARGFDLTAPTLFAASLLRLGEQEHVLLLNMHHAVSDGWSLGIFNRELSALYAAALAGRTDTLPAPALQYADYAAWQRSPGQRARLREQLDYWTVQLRDLPPLLNLPLDRARPAQQTFAGTCYLRQVPAALTQALKTLSQRHGASLYMTLGAAFAVLLHRYSGQDDIAFGTPVANRPRPELEQVIGFFVNTLVIRVGLEGAPAFSNLLQQVRQTCLDAYGHQELPFEHLVAALNPVRDPSHSPLFQVMFSYENTSEDALRLERLEVESLESESGAAKFDLSLSMEENDGRLTARFDYNTDLFDAPTIERMAAHYATLLESIVAAPDCPVPALGLVDEPERLRLLDRLSGQDRPYPAACVHELFSQQAARTPEALAVVCEQATMTYAQLERSANRLAHRLRQLGAGPGTLVGLCLRRGPDMVTGMLAILKAGAAYVPLDPAYPAERLQYMTEHAQIAVMLTEEALLGQLPASTAQLLCLDRDQAQWMALPDTPPTAGAEPHDLAYVIYTSGSTGKPKGVMIEHQSLSCYIAGFVEQYGVGVHDRILQFASISFDAAGEEIYAALVSGARLVLRSEATPLDPPAMLARLAQWNITIADFPTAYWHRFTAGLAGANLPLPPGLRLMVIGGEAASPETASAWLALPGMNATLVNTYGPTEATIVATRYEVARDWRPPTQGLQIGRAVPNTRIYLLDGAGQPVPQGVCGEIHIGGDQLARGYLHRPDLTAERFVAAPFEAGRRLYRTGDLARWNADGELEFLGRADSQVKIRGLRIELGEIESVLLQHPAVAQAVVVARDAQGGDKQLVAYVTAKDGSPHDAAQLRAHAGAALPAYMVPSAFVTLAALPLSPNGKVDHRALPAPDAAAFAVRRVGAPRGAVETALAAIWSELLGVARIGRDDNFFELGGHSLLAITLIERMRAQGLQVEVRSLFATPTLAGLSAATQEYEELRL